MARITPERDDGDPGAEEVARPIEDASVDPPAVGVDPGLHDVDLGLHETEESSFPLEVDLGIDPTSDTSNDRGDVQELDEGPTSVAGTGEVASDGGKAKGALGRKDPREVRVFTVQADADPDAWEAALAKARDHAGKATDGDADGGGRILRYALALRGGVSLAVWIGGAVAELDLLRAIRVFDGKSGTAAVLAWDEPEPPDPIVEQRVKMYAWMLARRRFHRVEIDVLAGASAGGLNSVLLATAQRAGRSSSRALQVWEEAGAIGSLLRPEGIGGVESVLQGDDYFYPKLRDTLLGFYETAPHPGLVTDAVSVDLSATVINAQDARLPAVREGRAGFHFQVGGKGNHIPTREDDAELRLRSIERLALAARTTSSFPGAFEPATIVSLAAEPGGAEPPELSEMTGGHVKSIDMSGAFLAHRSEWSVGPYRVVDGGVFDNIPIARATRAIRLRRAETPVGRVLVYLDPSPPLPDPVPPRRAKRFGDALAVVSMALASRTMHESALEDEAAIARDEIDRWRQRGRREPYAAVVGPTDDQGWDEREKGYARSRAASDSGLLTEILTGIEAWQLSENAVPRRAWTMAPDAVDGWIDALNLSDALNDATSDGSTDYLRTTRDAIAARDAASWLLTCVQWIELATRRSADPPRDQRERRQRVRAACYHAIDLAEASIRSAIDDVAAAAQQGLYGPEVVARWWRRSDPAWREVASTSTCSSTANNASKRTRCLSVRRSSPVWRVRRAA